MRVVVCLSVLSLLWLSCGGGGGGAQFDEGAGKPEVEVIIVNEFGFEEGLEGTTEDLPDVPEGFDQAEEETRQDCPGAPGCPCRTNNDCFSYPFCLEAWLDYFCMYPCVEDNDCPSGYKCVVVGVSGQDTIFGCMTPILHSASHAWAMRIVLIPT